MRIIFAVDKIQAGTTDIIPACALNVFLNAAINHQIRPSATWTLCNKLLHKVTIRIFSAGTFVGVDFLAEPLSSVGARQHSPDFSGLPVSLLASTSSQSLCLPSKHANIPRIFPARLSHCWRRPPRKAFIFRRGTPTFSGFSRPAGVIVGVAFLAGPLSSVETRQPSPDFPDLPASLLASTSPQSLYPPSGHANMLRFFSARRKPLSAADRHNGKIFDRYGGFFLTAKFLSQEKKPSFESPFPYR